MEARQPFRVVTMYGDRHISSMDGGGHYRYRESMMKRTLAVVAVACALGAAPAPLTAPTTDTAAAPAPEPKPTPGGAQYTGRSTKLMSAGDLPGSMAAADAAVSAGGGADAFAARAAAARATGRPVGEAISDLASAAALDPAYRLQYRGLLAQRDSQLHPDTGKDGQSHGLGGISMVAVGLLGAGGVLLVFLGVFVIYGPKKTGVAATAPPEAATPPDEAPKA
jgi:hypothetical protein